MASTPEVPAQDAQSADAALKKRLLSRIAIAGVVVVALLGGLAVVDALYLPKTPKEKAEKAPSEEVVAKASEATEEKPAETEAKTGAKAEEKTPEKPAETAQAEKKPEEKVARTEAAAEPERTAASAAPPPRPVRPLTVPATARPASIRPAEPVVAPRRPEAATETARTEERPNLFLRHAPPSRPLTQAAESGRQYVVQMGVFNSVANAEELRAKLELNGIPAQIEARVQVGPFGSRQEADAAREKLRALGMESGILTAIRR